MSIVFLLPGQRRRLLGASRKSRRKKLRRMLDTQEWISRVRWYAAHRDAKPDNMPLVAGLCICAAFIAAWLWAVLS